MTLFLTEALQKQIQSHARQAPDEEVCGLLLGRHNRVAEILRCRNVAEDIAGSFELDPVALISAHKAARNGGLQVVGHYHSHPNRREGPSPRDQASASCDGAYWVIVTQQSLSAWRAVERGLLPVPILPY
jgi:desampylase